MELIKKQLMTDVEMFAGGTGSVTKSHTPEDLEGDRRGFYVPIDEHVAWQGFTGTDVT